MIPAPIRRIVHLFPGQGDFTTTTLIRALRNSSVVRDAAAKAFTAIDQVGKRHGIEPLHPALTSPNPPNGRDLAAGAPGTLELATFGASMTAYYALCAIGLAPTAIVSVSFGDLAGLAAAGAFDTVDGAELAYQLALLLRCSTGGMTLLAAGEPAAATLLRDARTTAVVIACVNSESETVLSGPVAELDQIEQCAAAGGRTAVRLRLPFLSHHPLLAREADQFRELIRAIDLGPCRIPVHPAVLDGSYNDTGHVIRGLADNLVHPARVRDALVRGCSGCDALLLEAGTGDALARAAANILSGSNARATLADSTFDWQGFD
jgi:[acyl-carrier-protein] S-malonyltransferase